jgi:hypothetical protein
MGGAVPPTWHPLLLMEDTIKLSTAAILPFAVLKFNVLESGVLRKISVRMRMDGTGHSKVFISSSFIDILNVTE